MSRVFRPSEAHKLEDPERLKWLPPADVVQQLELRPGSKVADIGAGTGYFSIPIAHAVGSAGQVFAVDLQPEMLSMLREKLSGGDAPVNISLHQGDASHIPLPDAKVDLVFFANIWHELDDHEAVLEESRRILSPAGRIAILDWRQDRPSPPGPPQDHRIAMTEITALLMSNGWKATQSANLGGFSYLVVATRPVS